MSVHQTNASVSPIAVGRQLVFPGTARTDEVTPPVIQVENKQFVSQGPSGFAERFTQMLHVQAATCSASRANTLATETITICKSIKASYQARYPSKVTGEEALLNQYQEMSRMFASLINQNPLVQLVVEGNLCEYVLQLIANYQIVNCDRETQRVALERITKTIPPTAPDMKIDEAKYKLQQISLRQTYLEKVRSSPEWRQLATFEPAVDVSKFAAQDFQVIIQHPLFIYFRQEYMTQMDVLEVQFLQKTVQHMEEFEAQKQSYESATNALQELTTSDTKEQASLHILLAIKQIYDYIANDIKQTILPHPEVTRILQNDVLYPPTGLYIKNPFDTGNISGITYSFNENFNKPSLNHFIHTFLTLIDYRSTSADNAHDELHFMHRINSLLQIMEDRNYFQDYVTADMIGCIVAILASPAGNTKLRNVIFTYVNKLVAESSANVTMDELSEVDMGSLTGSDTLSDTKPNFHKLYKYLKLYCRTQQDVQKLSTKDTSTTANTVTATTSGKNPGVQPSDKPSETPIAGYYNNKRWFNPNYNHNKGVETNKTNSHQTVLTAAQVETANKQFFASKPVKDYLATLTMEAPGNISRQVSLNEKMYIMFNGKKFPYTATATPCSTCSSVSSNPCVVKCYLTKCNKCNYYGHAPNTCRQQVMSGSK